MLKKVSKLHLLLYREMTPVVIVGVAILTFIAFSREFQRISHSIVFSGGGITQFVRIISLIIPAVLFVTLPMALLVGIVTGLSRLSHDHEITAFKSCGIGLNRLVPPVVLLAFVASSFVFFCTTRLVPYANAQLRDLLVEMLRAGVAAELKPRTFHDRFNNFVFYIEDSDNRSARWRGIFIVDRTKPGAITVHTAKEGSVQLFQDTLQMTLTDQAMYSQPINDPESCSLATFETGVIPIHEAKAVQAPPIRNMEKSMGQLEMDIHLAGPPAGADPKRKDELIAMQVEYYQRYALPFACLAFAFIGIPLGVGARRGGRSAGFVISVAVVGLYYLCFIYAWKIGAYGGVYPLSVGVWIPNVVFTLLGALLIWIGNREIHPLSRLANHPCWGKLAKFGAKLPRRKPRPWAEKEAAGILETLKHREARKRFKLLKVVDRYLVTEFLKVLMVTLCFAIGLFTIFTLFELMDYIYKNSVPLVKVVEYFFFVSPMVLLQALPFCILIAMLVAFGLMEKSNQILVLKSAGISVYRIALPVVMVIVVLIPVVFIVQDQVLPYANRRQDELYNEFKGRKPQSFHHPETSWLMGGKGRIYNFGDFDQRQGVLRELWIFETDLANARLKSLMFIHQANWDESHRQWRLSNGWRRKFDGTEPGLLLRFVDVPTKGIEPPSFFKTETRKADKMSFGELEEYIGRLQQKGYNTLELEVDLHKKISYPLVILVMLLLGLPFAFKMGKRGTVYGIAVSTVIGIVYWALFNVFTAMGAFGILPPLFAAWAPNLFFGFASIYLIFRMRT